MSRLGVNIDHVATLRQARGEFYPRPEQAAEVALNSGADQITIHLREDRRHIQDHDIFAVKAVTERAGKLLNLEMGANPEITQLAIECRPDWVCLVPEKREELTTEGGLALEKKEVLGRVEQACKSLRQAHPTIKISLFLEAKPDILALAQDLGADAVEIHTGHYAKLFLQQADYAAEVALFQQAAKFLSSAGIAVHAGHGLTFASTKTLVELGLFQEYNIGHWIIAQSIFDGLGPVVSRFVELLKEH